MGLFGLYWCIIVIKKPYNQLLLSKKYNPGSKYPILGGTDLVPGGQNYLALRKVT